MTSVYVVFKDDTQKEVVTAFPGPQDESVYPGITELDDKDERYTSFMQKANSFFGATS
ncbi:hypothetical protein IAQ00_10120 [Pantoea ananatis]|uniref:hypothetical protein n=1 Tax=Pantoea ananas TaxID=553 RepID=UPI0013004960|nr:hypothetical protein [Pantoea ananatis]MCW0353933.1 hypothetical protein [Pantoea ananatis]USL60054.1 hypothetical protein IAQ00_10120 [Pantoea ananatis]